MLAFTRRITALVLLLAFAALCSGLVPEACLTRFTGMPQVQFVPLLLSALRGGVVAAALLTVVVVVTALFGRVYCSWICPLGILQDIVNRLLRPHGIMQARYTPHHFIVRALFAFAAFGGTVVGGVGVLAYLDPYSIAARTFGLLPRLLQNPAGTAVWLAIAVTAFSSALPLAMAAWRGRLYCNTICPVGAVLGLLARRAPFAPQIDVRACRRCASCLRRCKAHAIDLKQGRIDRTRCVGCYDCLSACPHHAVKLRKTEPQKSAAVVEAADPTRRALVGLGALSLASAFIPMPARAEEGATEADSGDSLPILPPGAGESREHFLNTCTGCGLCIANCPTGVLRPSLAAHGWAGFLKPYLAITAPRGVENGHYCRYDCNRCSSLCPTGALSPLSLAEKQHTRIATAHHSPARCIPWQTGYECGHCVAACPTGALRLRPASVPVRDHPDDCTACRRCVRVCPQGAVSLRSHPRAAAPDRRIAVIDYSKCIGCGACAAACRRRVIRAVQVEVPEREPERCIGCGACTAHCPATPDSAMVTKALR